MLFNILQQPWQEVHKLERRWGRELSRLNLEIHVLRDCWSLLIPGLNFPQHGLSLLCCFPHSPASWLVDVQCLPSPLVWLESRSEIKSLNWSNGVFFTSSSGRVSY